jgi:hypothetical protein
MATLLETVRSKYPAYQDTPDDELALAIADKHPVYLERDPQFAGYVKSLQARTTPAEPVQLQADNRALNDRAATAGGEPLQIAPGAMTQTAEAIGEEAHNKWTRANTPLVEVARPMSPEELENIRQTRSKPEQVLAGVANTAAHTVNFFTSPLGIATLGVGALPAAAQRAIALAFGAHMASQTPELMRQLGEETSKPMEEWNLPVIAELTSGAAVNTAFATLAGKHGLTPTREAMVSRMMTEMERAKLPEGEIRFSPTANAERGVRNAESEISNLKSQSPTPVPEPASTIAAQFEATLDPTSSKKATLVTPGAETPTVPGGLLQYSTEAGTVYYNPQKTSRAEVRAAFAGEAYGELLGMSTAKKPDLAEPTAVLQTKNAEGTVVQDEVVTPATIPSAIEASQAVAPKGTQELKPAEQVIAERQAATTPKRPDVPTITARHLKEAREVLAAERPPDILDEIGDNFRGVKIPEAKDYDWVRERVKALRQAKGEGLGKAQKKALFEGGAAADTVFTALNETKQRFENLDQMFESMLTAAETRINARDPNRPEVLQMAERIAQAERETKSARSEVISDWDAAAASTRAELAAMSGSSLLASKGDLATDFPKLMGGLDQIRPMETPEILRLTRDAFASEVTAKKLQASLRGYAKANNIALSKDLFADPQAVAMVMAHEIGHVNDFMPQGTMKRGNLIGRLIGSTNKFMQGQLGWMKDKALREELVALSAYWRPWDRTKAKESFRKYRDSSTELYADALSVLLNSPGLLQEKAPKFYKAFFDRLDAKPQFKREFFALQDLIAQGPEAVLEKRSAQSREAFEKGEQILHEKISLRQAARKGFPDFLTKMRIQSFDIADFVRRKLGSKDPAHPSQFDRVYEEWKFDDNKNAADLSRIYNDMVQPLLKTGLDEHHLGQVLELQRIAGGVDSFNNMQAMRKALGPKMDVLKQASKDLLELERKGIADAEAEAKVLAPLDAAGIPAEYIDIYRRLNESQGTRAELANAQGRSPALADAELQHLLSKLAPEQNAAVLDAAAKYRELIYERMTEARDVGIVNALTFDNTITPNKNSYAAFRPLEKIEDYVSPVVRKAMGSLSDIENPFITTLLKLQSLNNLIELQKVKNVLRDDYRAKFGEESFKRAETRWNGRRMEAVPPGRDVGRVEIYENGKKVAYDTDPYVAKMFEQITPLESFWLNKVIQWPFQNLIYPLIIKYNPGFLAWSNPKRDLGRTIRNLYATEGVTRRELLPNYADPQVLRAVSDYLAGRPNPLAETMIRKKAITPSWQGFAHIERDDVMTDLLRRYRLADEPTRSKLKAGAMWLPTKINQGGSFLEALPKFASYKTLIERGVEPERASYLVRNYVGTPNFKVKGQWGTVQNAWLPFMNIFLQGLRADARIAMSPKTASGWWTQYMLQHGWQSAFVALASAGVFGAYLQNQLAAVSEYDKTNYGIIPLGTQPTGEYAMEGGKTVYLRIPRDETSRFLGALIYKTTRAAADKAKGNPEHPQALPTELFAYGEGVLPSPSPVLEIASAWTQYAGGRNPYDPFRQRPIIGQKEFDAGGTAAAAEMFNWTLNQAGVLNLAKYDRNANTTTEAVVGAAPVLNRALKISDQGRREQQMNSERLDTQAKARLRVQYNEATQSLLAKHAWLQQLGPEKRTPVQEQLYHELHDWKTKFYDRVDEAAWNLRDDRDAQQDIVRGLNTEAERMLKGIQ